MARHGDGKTLAQRGRCTTSALPTLFTVHEGLTVEVRGERDEWIQVSLPNGLFGWLSRDSAGLIR